MKKFMIFAACLLLLVATGLQGVSLASVGVDYPMAEHTFYIADKAGVEEAVIAFDKAHVVINGYTAQVKCPVGLASKVRPVLRNISGESFSFVGSKQDMTQIAEKYGVDIRDLAEVGNVYTIYGHTSAFKDYEVNIDGKSINIQIAYRNGVVTVGSPVILGSY